MTQAVSYSHGFVGAVGPRSGEVRLRLPGQVDIAPQATHRGAFYQVLSFGSTSATLPEGPVEPGRAWFKGRPFFESGSGSLAELGAPDEGRVRGALAGLDGRFSLFFAASDGRAVCATDILAHGPMFYCERGGRLYFATHLGALLASIGDWEEDPVGVAGLAVAGAPIDGRTSARGVGRLRACEYVAVSTGGADGSGPVRWSVEKYADLEALLVDPGARPEPMEARFERLDDLLRRSVAREGYTGGEGFMLSGGRDSTMVGLTLLRELGMKPEAATYGIPCSTDLERGRRIAARMGLRHRAIPYDSWDLASYVPRIVGLNGGMSGFQASCLLPGFEYAGRTFGRVITGYVGDAAVGAYLPSGELDFESILRSVLFYREAPDLWIDAYFADEVHVLVSELRAWYDRSMHLTPLQRWLLAKLTLYYAPMVSQAFDLSESYCEISTPLYTRAHFRFAMNLPEELVRDRLLYDAWLERTIGMVLPDGEGSPWSAPAPEPADEEFRPDSIDWGRMLNHTRPWLRAQVEEHCRDPRTRALCLKSLARSEEWEGIRATTLWPTAISVMAAPLARVYCR